MITVLFKSIKKTHLTIVSLFIISGFSYADPIGGVIESTGVTSLVRESNRLISEVGTDVNIYDEAETANGRMLIEFLDNENRKDFYDYVNRKVYFHPFNMFICKSKEMGQGKFDTGGK